MQSVKVLEKRNKSLVHSAVCHKIQKNYAENVSDIQDCIFTEGLQTKG